MSVSRFYGAIVLIAWLGAIPAWSSGSGQGLVPPPPPIAIDLGAGLSGNSGFAGANTYPGTYTRTRRAYSVIDNGYAGYSTNNDMSQAQNNTAQAMRQYNQAFEIDMNSSEALKQRGLYRYTTGDLVGANSDLSKALSLAPHDRQAAEALLDLWRRQVAGNPLQVNGHLGLARAYLQIGDLESAQAEYRVVVKLDPENPHLPAARKCVKQALARRAALKCFETAKTLNSVGDHKEAFEKTGEALAYCPSDPEILLLRAQLAEKLSDYQEARKMYLAVLSEDPKNHTAVSGLKALKSRMPNPASSSHLVARPESRALVESVHPSNIPANQTNVDTTGSALCAPIAATDPGEVASLANFIGSVRNLAIVQKNQSKKVEKASQKTLKSLSLQPHSVEGKTDAPSTESPIVLQAETAQMAPFIDPEMPKLAPPIAFNKSAFGFPTPNLPASNSGSAYSEGAVRLELQKVALANSGITLTVVLRNNSNEAIVIPSDLKVAVKSPGKREKLVKARFYSSQVSAQDSLKGTIRLPESEFSPSTDVFLPNFPGQQRDLHLSIPLASL